MRRLCLNALWVVASCRAVAAERQQRCLAHAARSPLLGPLVATVDEVRSLDRLSAARGVPAALLMESAGAATARAGLKLVSAGAGRALFVCGRGDNGGDGFVAARHWQSAGLPATVLLVGRAKEPSGATAVHAAAAKGYGVTVHDVGDEPEQSLLEQAVDGADIVFDCVLGSGLSRPLKGSLKAAVEAINGRTRSQPVVAVDIPTGIDGDTGAVMGVAVRATATVTFGVPRFGNLLYPGYAYMGQLLHSPLSYPHDAVEVNSSAVAAVALPRRDAQGHKGSFGRALFAAGAKGYYGAPALASAAFLRAGGGYSRLATPSTVADSVAASGLPGAAGVVLMPQPEDESGGVAPGAAEGLVATARSQDMMVVGPGLGLSAGAREFALDLLRRVQIPAVVDGDAITALVQCPEGAEQLLKSRTAPTVITPHLGELARLLGVKSVAELTHSSDGQRRPDWPVATLRRAAARLHATIVMKGPHTMTVAADGRCWISLSGNSGMGTAGTGDVLTGTIAAVHAHLGKADVPAAAAAGVFLHGHAGDLAADELGEDGVGPADLLRHLPAALRHARQQGSLGSGVAEPFRRYTVPAADDYAP
eukprot:TRINITY_DN39904_c0_g1_i1.p1 TRINITY_DN39904_c0_g1~~TRINITY_DN39904_c0_g1_i1.p1  ORF type:complete len:608 (+),score=173.88 TRINITY_DN39904_c0_g1_i1:50-1825(+)